MGSGAGGLGAHEALLQGSEAQADAYRLITPAPPFSETYGQPGARAATEAANALLAALSAEQANAIILPIDSPLRSNWSNLPSGVTRFERNGLRLGDLTAVQLERVFDFLAAALGPHGYETATQVVGADAVLAASPRAASVGWSDGNYWLAFFGEPALQRPLELAVRRASSGDQREVSLTDARSGCRPPSSASNPPASNTAAPAQHPCWTNSPPAAPSCKPCPRRFARRHRSPRGRAE